MPMSQETVTISVDTLRTVVREETNYVVDTKLRLKRNGDPTPAFLWRLLKDQRTWVAGWIAISAIYQFGGSARALATKMDLATAAAVSAGEKADQASVKADNVASALDQTQMQLALAVKDIQQQGESVTDVKDGIARAVKRDEFASALAQQILPRLERIERYMWDQPKR